MPSYTPDLPRSLTAVYAYSSFFWLGLVGSLLIGLFLTVFRTRNARLAAGQSSNARTPLVRPEVWEVNVAPGAIVGAGETVARKWTELLVSL